MIVLIHREETSIKEALLHACCPYAVYIDKDDSI